MTSLTLGINWDTIFEKPFSLNTNNDTNIIINNDNNLINKEKILYLLPQQLIPTKIPYTNVNTNYTLRDSVSSFFTNKSIKWMNNKELPHCFKSILLSNKGNDFMYGILRKYVNKHNVNWYDLREKKYDSVKRYIIHKLSKSI